MHTLKKHAWNKHILNTHARNMLSQNKHVWNEHKYSSVLISIEYFILEILDFVDRHTDTHTQ